MGMPWADLTQMNNGAMDVRPFASTGPKWFTPNYGLCLQGTCTTRSCDAYNQLILCNWGVGKPFNLGTDSPKVVCPNCQQHVIPETWL